jgi:DNA (cytosine-5)-methyltransferase 1
MIGASDDWTDFFAGAGGSSTGISAVPGQHVRTAANHWQTAVDIHNANHPTTDHAIVDLHQERPSFFRRTRRAWFSPECTKWSQANGAQMPAIEEGLFEDPLSDDVKQRSRLLMFDVLRYVEFHRYDLFIVENVVDIATQAKYRTAWTAWRQELRALGYRFRVVSLNSMHAQAFGAPAPQSRDRIYVVCWPEGAQAPDLDRILRPRAYCPKCDVVGESVQSFKRGREVGRYRQAYVYCCPRCGSVVEPGWLPAATAIDWSLPGKRIGDRKDPLAEKTLDRIAAGIARYWGPLTLEAAGNTYDAADPRHPHHGELDAYYRSWPVGEPLRALHTTNSKALAVPVEGREGKVAKPVIWPGRTQSARNETGLAFITEMYGTSTARPVTDPAGTFTAGGNHHGLVQDPFILDRRFEYRARSADDPLSTITANDTSKALITRHNNNRGDQGAMTTPSDEYMRTLTTTAQQSIIRRPGEATAADLKAAREMLPEVLFRMFEPHEVAAGMAFPADYVWQPQDHKRVTKRDLVKAAGNAVTPPAARDLVAAAVESLGVGA